jgi:hypothetical protein
MKLLTNNSENIGKKYVVQLIEDIQYKAALKTDEIRILRQAKMNALLKEERNKERSNIKN